jgi:hypothetical protein
MSGEGEATESAIPGDMRPPLPDLAVKSLFHYTTAAGLLGMISSATIWATDVHYLNDAQEAIYAERAVVEAVRSMESPTRNPTHWAHEHGESAHETFDQYREFTLDELADNRFGVYVACFCEEGDLLSQWRAYGSEHGYAVEINARAIQQAVRDLLLSPPTAGGVINVRYGPDAAAAAAMDAVATVEVFNLNHPGVKAHYKALELATILATVKHPGFSEEREWRLFAGFEAQHLQGPDSRNPTQFRATGMALVPYISIDMPRESIISVRVGPGDSPDVRAAGVRRLLEHYGMSAEVVASEVPYRT